jgi:hypothetical protein
MFGRPWTVLAPLGGQDRAVALGEHRREELLHEGDHRIEDEGHERPGALRGEIRCGEEAVLRRGRVVERVEGADVGADLLGQGGDGVSVGQIGGDYVRFGGRVCSRVCFGQFSGE